MERNDVESNSKEKDSKRGSKVTQERRKHGQRMHLNCVLQNGFWLSLLSIDFRTNGKNEWKKCCILQGMNAISEEYKFAKKSKCL